MTTAFGASGHMLTGFRVDREIETLEADFGRSTIHLPVSERCVLEFRVAVRDEPVQIDLPATPLRFMANVVRGSGRVEILRWDDHEVLAEMAFTMSSSFTWEGPEAGYLDPRVEYSLRFRRLSPTEGFDLNVSVALLGPVDPSAFAGVTA